MAKDWRISICTRYRPVAVLVLIIAVWVSSILALATIGRAIYHHQRKVWDAKLASIKVGTTTNELIRTLGKPRWTERVKSDQIQWVRGTGLEGLERVKAVHPELVIYHYEKTFFGMMGSEGYRVYLDETEERTVFRPGQLIEFWVLEGASAMFIFILSLGALAFLVWLCFRFWCARRLRIAGYGHPHNDTPVI